VVCWLTNRLQPSVDEFWKARQPAETTPDEIRSKSTEPCETETATTATGHTRGKRILMLGSMVAAPAVDFIAQRSDVELIIGISKILFSRSSASDNPCFLLLKASNSLSDLQNLAAPHMNVKYRVIDIMKESTYPRISSLKTHLLTTSVKLECYKGLCSLNKQFIAS
jgi:hypothetical protein